MSLGDVIATNLFIVDGTGAIDNVSGQSGSSVIATLSQSGSATILWTNATWTRITSPVPGWAGQLAANTVAIQNLFTSLGTNPIDLELGIRVTDQLGNPIVYANPSIKCYYSPIVAGLVSTNPFNNIGDGLYSIPSGVDTGAVTGLALSLPPRRVLVSVRKPSGGFNISATVVDGTPTTDGFQFNLSGQTDSTGYKLDYVFLF